MKNIFTLTDALDLLVEPKYTDVVEAIDYISPALRSDLHIRLNLGNPDGTFDSRAAAEALEFKNAVLEHSLNYEVEDLEDEHCLSRTHIFTFIGGKFFLKLRLEK